MPKHSNTRICLEIPAIGRRNADGFLMNDLLKQTLDYYLKNVTSDWDFTIIIAGEGEVRVGKSVLAQQIAGYWNSEIKRLYGIDNPLNIEKNLCFEGHELIKKGNYLGNNHKYAAIIYDEAGGDLDSTTMMMENNRLVRSYLRECGQYNLLTILVLPEFFELPRGIAISRSNCLINVFWLPDDEGFFRRGYFKFFSRPNKKMLYINGKKNLDYSCVYPDFQGEFENYYIFPEQDYRLAKAKALKTREKRSSREERYIDYASSCMKYMYQNGLTHREIADIVSKLGKFKINHSWVGRLLKGEIYNDEDDVNVPPD